VLSYLRVTTKGAATMMASPYSNFETAAQGVLAFLRQRFGFSLWMITRIDGNEWIVLHAEDSHYNIQSGTVLYWSDSLCFEMVKGQGPSIAPVSDDIPAYAAAPIGRQLPIKAYIGVPLVDSSGELFGTLCAIDPSPKPETIAAEQPLIEMMAKLLSSVLFAELKAADETRRFERLELDAETDSMTKLFNRRAWDRLLAKEESRCAQFGCPATVISIDLDDLKRTNDCNGHSAGDDLILRAANVLFGAVRKTDIVARLGGDEFGIIAVECNLADADGLVTHLRKSLADAQINASVGLAIRTNSTGLQGAWEAADKQMYVDKRSRTKHDQESQI
jgi:diguanylate cyclase